MNCFAHVTGRAILLLGLLFIVPGDAGAQDVTARVLPNGIHFFRNMLHLAGLKPVPDIASVAKAPASSLVIVFGDLRILQTLEESLPGGLAEYLKQGGALLVASDRGVATDVLRDTFHVVPNGTIVSNPKPEQALWKVPQLPFVNHFATGHPLFRGVKQLATNTPTFLQSRWRRLRPVAWFPRECIAQGVGPNGANMVFAAVNRRGPGQVLLLGGHSVFMNSMMDLQDNFNFAANCIEWFTKAPKRDRVLLIEEGRIIESFQVPLRQLPPPPMPTVAQINGLLRRLEEENKPNELLLSAMSREGDPDGFTRARLWIFRGVLLLLTVVALIYGWRRLRRGLYRREAGVPLVFHGVAQTVPEVSPVDQRQQIMLHEGNLWEAARELARQCFAEYAGRLPHLPPPPRVEVRSGWWQRRGLVKQVARLWQLAYDSPARPVTPVQFRRFAEEADTVKEALALGILVLELPVATATAPALPRTGSSPAASS